MTGYEPRASKSLCDKCDKLMVEVIQIQRTLQRTCRIEHDGGDDGFSIPLTALLKLSSTVVNM